MPKEEHDVHMAKVSDGLNQILASNDINEIKTIAQALLAEESKEQEVESGPSEEDAMKMGIKKSLEEGGY